MDLQHGDEPPKPFSYLADTLRKGRDDIFTLNEWREGMFHVEQLPCAITYTTSQTHEIVRANLDKSPLYCGRIEGVGPRYCPSLEDKVVCFADKERHQLFLEPEGRHTDEYYINGCSTSLPFEVQLAFIRSVPGLENAEIMRAGYAVEYDFSPPTQLQPSLETKRVEGLFFAGQLNGTSGYEEAAGQGLIAGINAVRKIQGEAPADSAPRSSLHRCPHRRPRDQGHRGTVPHVHFPRRASAFAASRQRRPSPHRDRRGNRPRVTGTRSKNSAPRKTPSPRRAPSSDSQSDGQPFAHLLKRPDVAWGDLPSPFAAVDPEIASQLETEIKYDGYLKREQAHIERNRSDEERTIPDWLDFDTIPGLKAEARAKLKKIQPRTFGQAARISGINPTDVALLQVHTKRGKRPLLPLI